MIMIDILVYFLKQTIQCLEYQDNDNKHLYLNNKSMMPNKF